jgi:predicted lipid-binding transport protein (Tim44 family)
MNTSLRSAICAAAIAFTTPVLAEDAHHPPADAAPAAQTAQTPQAQPSRPMQPGMGPMGQDMGMMDQGGMMGGMPGMMPMMGMMEMMHGQHVEGRLAFIKAELKIAGAQEKAWNDFANAVRQASAKTRESGGHPMSGAVGNPLTPMQLAERYEKHLAARLEAIRMVKPTLEPLYASLNDEQKKTFAQVHMILHGAI